MGTGVNAQRRLKALHHLDVPWLPSQIEQREGRIERQGNEHDEIEIYAYATKRSVDATGWQILERKARFIDAAMPGTGVSAGSRTQARRRTSSRSPRRSHLGTNASSRPMRLKAQADRLAVDLSLDCERAASRRDPAYGIQRAGARPHGGAISMPPPLRRASLTCSAVLDAEAL
jgi:hypothetical protein